MRDPVPDPDRLFEDHGAAPEPGQPPPPRRTPSRAQSELPVSDPHPRTTKNPDPPAAPVGQAPTPLAVPPPPPPTPKAATPTPPAPPDPLSPPPPDLLPLLPPPEPAKPADEDPLTRLVPWGISLALHTAVICVTFFVVWSVVAAVEDKSHIVAALELAPEPALDPIQTTAVTNTRPVQAEPTPDLPPVPTDQLLEAVDLTDELIGLEGLSAADATPLAPTPAQPALTASFMGNRGGNARSIVFLIDASGSLVDVLDYAIQELARSIRRLNAQQKFTVIFIGNFDGQPFREIPPGNLQPATTAFKNQTVQWIDLDEQNVFNNGTGDPMPAIRRALSYRPDLLYLLSDDITGRQEYELNQQKLLEDIRDVNRARTKINTIQFVYPDPLAADGSPGTLELIAEQSGGNYRFVDEQDVTP